MRIRRLPALLPAAFLLVVTISAPALAAPASTSDPAPSSEPSVTSPSEPASGSSSAAPESSSASPTSTAAPRTTAAPTVGATDTNNPEGPLGTQYGGTLTTAAAGSSLSVSPAISRAEVIARAKSWADSPYPYSTGVYINGYRTDCSGFVSMAWNTLASNGAPYNNTTNSIQSITYPISKDELKPGDVLNQPSSLDGSGHSVIFEKWTDASRTRYWAYEQAGDGGTHYRSIPYKYWSQASLYGPRRYINITDEAPPPAMQPTMGLVQDINGDGGPDILARNATGAMSMYPSSTVWGIDAPYGVGAGWGGYDMITAAGDVTGDGIPDLYAREVSTGILWLYPLNSLGVPTDRISAGGGWGYFNLIIPAGDQNGDGTPDLFARTPDGFLRIYYASPYGGWKDSTWTGSAGWHTLDIVLAASDVTGDGRQDLLARDHAGALILYGTGFGGTIISRMPVAGGGGWNMYEIVGTGITDGYYTYIYGMDAHYNGGNLVWWTINPWGVLQGPWTTFGGGWNIWNALI